MARFFFKTFFVDHKPWGWLKTYGYKKKGFNTGDSPCSSHFGWTKPLVSPTMFSHFSPINGRNRGRPSPKKGTDLSPESCHAVMPGTLHDYHFGSRGIYNVEVFFFWKDNCAENSWHFLKIISSWSTMCPGTGPSKSTPVFPHWMADGNYKNSPTWNKANLLDHFNSCYVALWVFPKQHLANLRYPATNI